MNNWKMYWSKGAKMTVKKMLEENQKSKEDKKEDTEAKKES